MNKDVIHRVALDLAFISLMASCVSTAFAQGDGIYADFNTSMGSFTCRLEYALAPRTVANFIALATGGRAWLGLPSGQVRTHPFYDGTTFHRVISGFMNQGGSRNGLGTDGPGYQFLDEFVPQLRHDGFGVLSMANSGPDSNGSQFFITVSAQVQLNDVHSVFGRLVGGSNVVYAINHVATDGSDKPLTNVVLQSVVIRRIGVAAQAFDIHAQGLPAVTNLHVWIAHADSRVSLTFSNRLNADNRLHASTNFVNWTGSRLGVEVVPTMTNTVYRNASAPSQFFLMSQVQYPDSLYAPRNVFGRSVTLNFSGGIGTVVMNLDNSGSGSYTYNGTPGTVQGYNWIQDPYRGRFSPILFSGVIPMSLHLDFDTHTTGTFKGTGYPNYPSSIGSFAVVGTFGASP